MAMGVMIIWVAWGVARLHGSCQILNASLLCLSWIFMRELYCNDGAKFEFDRVFVP